MFLSAFNLFAEQDTSNVIIFKSNYNYGSQLDFVPFDTNLNQFYQYQQNGFRNKASLGNTGLALSTLTAKSNPYGFNLGETCFDSNYEKLHNLEVYKALKPFARISYTSGPKKYQDFNLFFTQNVSARFNFAFSFRTFKSDGFYLNQETNGRLFWIQNSFETKKGRYGYLAKFSVNSGYANENGGIKGDSLYKALIQENKLGVQVWLESATNRYDKRKLEVHQYFRLKAVNDSVANRYGGSIRLTNVGIIDDLWFEDSFTDSLYYDQFSVVVPDSLSTYDRSHLLGFKNKLLYQYDFEESSTELRLGINADGYDISTIDSDTILYEATVFGGFEKLILGPAYFSGLLEKGVYGFNDNGHRVEIAVVSKPLVDRFKVGIGFENTKQLPDFKYMYYKSASIEWNNELDYVGLSQYDVSIADDSSKLSLSGKLRTYDNYVYYNSNVLPVQYKGGFSRIEIGVNKAFTWKSLHFDVNIIYQEVTDEAPVNIAKWIWKISVYHQRYLFSDALEIRYGVDYWQTSSYSADYYIPFTRTFTYQDSYSVGNYPFFNFYVSARIKGAQGFVNFQNIGQLFLDDSYMMSPYYPLQDFGLSFGLRWDFYN